MRNAFDLMIQAQKDKALPTLPQRIPARTKKDDLYNAIIDLLEQMDLTLTSMEASGGGKQLVRALCNTLWYIDGRHETFSDRSFNIPDVFSQFQGYNRPELSKHRKRDHSNLNAVELRGLSSELFTVLLNPFFKRSCWCMFQVHVELLAKSLASYVNYLGERNKQMKSHHSALAPSRQIEDNLAISFLPVSASRPSVLDSLNQTLAVSSELEIIELSSFSPINPQQKYRYVCTFHIRDSYSVFTYCVCMCGYTCTRNVYNM